jgi:hypothetical protein
MLVRSVGHLSSAGYKLIRDSWDLLGNTLGLDLAALVEAITERHGTTERQRRALFSVMAAMAEPPRVASTGGGDLVSAAGSTSIAPVDLLLVDRATIAAAADGLCPPSDGASGWAEQLASDEGFPWEADPTDTACGPMLGLSPSAVLIEELRRYHLALGWLRTSGLVRVTYPGDRHEGDDAMVALVHDGFGRPLREWSEAMAGRPASATHALTSPRDVAFLWAPKLDVRNPNREPDLGDADDDLVLANLRWRGGRVRADLRRVVFANCDFRGSQFDECRMIGVTFVNCLLDGCIFSDCSIEGPLTQLPADTPWTPDQPLFELDIRSELARDAGRYRWEADLTDSTRLLSHLPGAPALPAVGPTDTFAQVTGFLREVARPLPSGGMVVYGGRISGLGMRKCVIAEGSGVGLRHTTGSGLEMVELRGPHGRYDIFGSCLRHTTFSSAYASQEAAPVIDVQASGSLLTQLWIGQGVTGEVRVRDCTFVQAWNASDATVWVTESSVYGILGRQEITFSDQMDGLVGEELMTKLVPFRNQSQRADYRRNPARTQAEMQQRQDGYPVSGPVGDPG